MSAVSHVVRTDSSPTFKQQMAIMGRLLRLAGIDAPSTRLEASDLIKLLDAQLERVTAAVGPDPIEREAGF